jgi:hypothetical protein
VVDAFAAGRWGGRAASRLPAAAAAAAAAAEAGPPDPAPSPAEDEAERAMLAQVPHSLLSFHLFSSVAVMVGRISAVRTGS